jgi:hypothetical protein
MKRSRFTDSQIVEILKEADTGLPVGEGGLSNSARLPSG